ncbi:hypothetical protein [Azotobacter chroococcum]|uniref:Uncharacterized protein n=1 Tax=Azotobacter chroococcum NCIMB 8003 TaxID=1328314 RepID=A0A0C4WSG4_9GAMM|nr:hypothetical protein [Azotobacter chroococcum]AJE23594.1 Hypothetical protein Achr_d620 [Azotobacter chroococcum NCIMB 8003]
MHAIFAIEPDAINNWQDLRYALEKFGYSKGLLIARYPKSWMRMVMEACHRKGLGDVELKRIEEKLQSAKDDRLVRIGLHYDGGSWLESVSTEAVLNQLSAVLVRDQTVSTKFHRIDDAHENLFDNRREVRVKRNANELAGAAKYILIASDQLVLVDPYFQPKQKCTKVLDSMLRVCQEDGSMLREVIIFSGLCKDSRSSAVERQEYERLLQVWINLGVSITIFRVAGDQLDQDFHARYLFNKKAGLRFDRGFVEPEAHDEREHLTDVVCMDTEFTNELNACYLEARERLNIADEITLGGA